MIAEYNDRLQIDDEVMYEQDHNVSLVDEYGRKLLRQYAKK